MMSMMDSTTAVVILIVLAVVLTVGVLVFIRVLAAREDQQTDPPRNTTVEPRD